MSAPMLAAPLRMKMGGREPVGLATPEMSASSAQITNRHLLQTLSCPYCGGSLASSHPTVWPVDEPPAYGILQCECSRFPVVDGIPILQQREGLDRVMDSIEVGDTNAALLKTFDVFRVTWARRSRLAQVRYRVDCARLVGSKWTFEEATSRVRRPKVFADYLFHRWANPSFLAAVPTIVLLGDAIRALRATLSLPAPPGLELAVGSNANVAQAPVVLDLACGTGHTSYLMRLLHPDLCVVSADHDFVSLYLAKRFLAPSALTVCVDAEVPLPFPDATFDGLFCLDAFHYLRNKRAIVRELVRTTRSDAVWMLPHLHNARQTNVTPGVPMSPQGYRGLFSLPSARLFDEQDLLRGYVGSDSLDLRAHTPSGVLEGAAALTLMAGPDILWNRHERFAVSFQARPRALVPNPIYSRTRHGGSVGLQFRWPNDVFARECATVSSVIPASASVGEEVLDGLSRGDLAVSADPVVGALLRKFVLVPVPTGYAIADAVRPSE